MLKGSCGRENVLNSMNISSSHVLRGTMIRTADWFSLLAVVFAIFGLLTQSADSQTSQFLGVTDLNDGRGTIDTRHRVAPGFECTLEKGEPSAGLKAFCSVDSDTLVLGQPVIFEFGIVNIGVDAAGVDAGDFSLIGGIMPVLHVADPSGIEYPYLSMWSVTRWCPCETAVGLSPGDTLTAVLQVTYYGSYELLFPFSGRWGLYCAYYARGDECHRGVQVASDIAWVEVVRRDSVDSLAWEVLRKTKKSLAAYDASSDDSIMTAFREIVDRYPRSAYYAYSLYMYSRCLQVSQEYEDAVRYFRRYRTEYPTSLLAQEAFFQIAQCLHELGRTAEAVASFDAAHEADRSNWKGVPRYRPKYSERRPWGRLLY